jgi:septum formation protein
MRPIDQKIYLASKSPRRRELLRQIGVEFELLLLREHTARGPDVLELVQAGELPRAYVERVTREKAETASATMLSRRLRVRPVLTADTTVTLDGRILNYCALPEPYDKAGGYAVQGRAAQFISHITGSHSGIMGLPLFETAQLLQQAGIRIL